MPQYAVGHLQKVQRIRNLEAQVAALRNGDLVAGAGVSGVFVPDATPEASMLVFSLHAPRAGEGCHALYVRGMLSEVLPSAASADDTRPAAELVPEPAAPATQEEEQEGV